MRREPIDEWLCFTSDAISLDGCCIGSKVPDGGSLFLVLRFVFRHGSTTECLNLRETPLLCECIIIAGSVWLERLWCWITPSGRRVFLCMRSTGSIECVSAVSVFLSRACWGASLWAEAEVLDDKTLANSQKDKICKRSYRLLSSLTVAESSIVLCAAAVDALSA